MANNPSALAIVEEDRIYRARNRLLSFTQFTKPDYRVNWHHHVMCQYLNRFIRGELRRLMFFLPPRHGKSELASRRTPAFLFGVDPNAQIIGASYADSLASMMNRDVQRIMDSEEYKLLFPGARIPPSGGYGSYARNNGMFEIIGKEGRYKSAGVGSGITGLGANYGFIDDPHKDRQEAESQTRRDAVWDWYTSTFYTRLQEPRSICLTMTRWHEDDLAGRLLTLAKQDPAADQWIVVNLPAICDLSSDIDRRQPGEALWESDFGIETLNSIRASIGPRDWSALYQQSPMPPGGGMFNESMFEFTDMPQSFDYTFMMADTAYKEKEENDFNVFTYFGVKAGELYIPDVLRLRIKASDIEIPLTAFVKPKQVYGFRGLYIEPKGHGIYLNQTLPTKGIIMPSDTMIKDFFSDRRLNKVERANNAIPHLSNRKIKINRNLNNKEDLLNEILSFPRAKHDDFVDTVIDGVKFVFARTIGILDVL